MSITLKRPKLETTSLAQFAELPADVHLSVLKCLGRGEAVQLSYTNKYFNKLINRELYKTIVIGGSTTRSIPVENLALFAKNLSCTNFLSINSIFIHSQSNLVTYDYSILYEKLYRLWDLAPNKVIKLINYDTKNVRQHKSMTNYVYERSCYFLQEDDPSLVNLKINNLTNWLFSDFDEAISLPFNANLKSLKLLVERGFKNSNAQLRGNSFVRNLQNLEELYLSTPDSTTRFCNYFDNHSLKLKLRSLAITVAHSFINGFCLDADRFKELFDIEYLEKLEVKMNCTRPGCQCITNFFRELGAIPNLRTFVLVNCNSNNSSQNIHQFRDLLEAPYFYDCIKSVKSFNINLSDCFNNHGLFKFEQLFKNLQTLNNLQSLVIPDFFKTWAPRFFDRLNKCPCGTCRNTRSVFTKMAEFDDANNYKHEFDELEMKLNAKIDRIESNKVNVNFYNYLVGQLKKQFVINIYSTNAIINFKSAFVLNSDFKHFAVLFAHSVPDWKLPVHSNLGGVVIQK